MSTVAQTTTRRNEGGRYSAKHGSAWYTEIEAANIQAAEAYAMAQAREEAAMFRTALAKEEAALRQDQIDAEDAARALTTALATQVGNAIAAMPEAASRITNAATLVQRGEVWPLTSGSFLVSSQSDTHAAHLVTRGPWTCTCPDHTHRQHLCKHIIAVQLTVKLGARYQATYAMPAAA